MAPDTDPPCWDVGRPRLAVAAIGNATGFTNFEYGVSGKWLEVLKEAVPGITRAAVLRDATNPAGTGQWGAIQAMASPLGVELSPIDVRERGEIERGISAFAAGSNRGLIVSSSGFAIVHRELIIALAARHRLPAVYPFRLYAIGGGLISYGPDPIDPHRRAAQYVDRILKGEKPADLPVQAPTKYELVVAGAVLNAHAAAVALRKWPRSPSQRA
jgi:putative ABC transport system substrate-binding protein